MIFSDLSIVLIIISTIVCLVKYQSIQKKYKILLFYLLLCLVTDIAGTLFFHQKINNLPILHVYTFLEFIIWSFFFRSLLAEKPFFKNYFWPFLISISLLIIANSVFVESLDSYNSNAKTLVQSILLTYSIYYLSTNFGKIDFSIGTNQSILIINFSVILYYSGTLFIFMFTEFLLSKEVSRDDIRVFWLFNAFLWLVFQILIFISIAKTALYDKSRDNKSL